MDDRRPAAGALIFDRAGIRELDRRALSEYGIPGVVLMENAGRGMVEVLRKAFSLDQRPVPVVIVCGRGNNGGDGYVAARHLSNAGIDLSILAVGEPDPQSDAGVNRRIVEHMGVRLEPWSAVTLRRDSVVIDALLGTGISRPVEGLERDVIAWMNGTGARVLAADLPSGLDADCGEPLGIAVRSTVTATMVGWKVGMLKSAAAGYVRRVEVVDIGAPRSLARALALPEFSRG